MREAGEVLALLVLNINVIASSFRFNLKLKGKHVLKF